MNKLERLLAPCGPYLILAAIVIVLMTLPLLVINANWSAVVMGLGCLLANTQLWAARRN